MGISFTDLGICPQCRDYCTWAVRDENGEEMDTSDPLYDETEESPDCGCGA